ncbi:hypothetical protein [Hyphococcus sp.]|uniref:hypothetical protein n=1 Tax=Hyphococcus sp. TaxID=2038636 RepID=UPI003CCBA6C5
MIGNFVYATWLAIAVIIYRWMGIAAFNANRRVGGSNLRPIFKFVFPILITLGVILTGIQIIPILSIAGVSLTDDVLRLFKLDSEIGVGAWVFSFVLLPALGFPIVLFTLWQLSQSSADHV